MVTLEAALEAYRAALAEIHEAETRAKAAVQEAKSRAEARRADLAAAMVAEARRGTPQVDIIRRTGYSRDWVRRVLRAGGIEP
jgi:chromosome segregation ATPase